MMNNSFVMKLGWELVTKREALWVQVLRYKYKCGNLHIPKVQVGSRASHVWRGIGQVWQLVEQGTSWIIKNGHSVKFWQDS